MLQCELASTLPEVILAADESTAEQTRQMLLADQEDSLLLDHAKEHD
jgi:hypothetical protein